MAGPASRMATDLEVERPTSPPDGGGSRRERQRRSRRPTGLIVAAVAVLLLIGATWATGALGYGVWWLTNTEPPAGRPLDVQVGDGFGWAIVGLDADAEPREVALSVAGTDQVGNRTEQHSTMRVVRSQYTQASIEVSASLLPLLQPQVRVAEDAH